MSDTIWVESDGGLISQGGTGNSFLPQRSGEAEGTEFNHGRH
jgi:hypothetical protein